MIMRIGFGYDVHRLEEGKTFTLGGIQIDHHKGATGHSDADVLIHAICDAFLGAANLGDIGTHFPDNDPSLKDIDSKLLLRKVIIMLEKNGYQIGNLDTTIALQKPKITGYIPKMKLKLAEVMNIAANQISIKATTTEKLGFEGREEGVSAYAVALVYLK
jgi:2-C-methyl-D-erythritol 2,4-cyclodiphosphate synthase